MDDLLDDWMRLDGRVKAFDAEFAERARADQAMRRFSTVPGIGPILSAVQTRSRLGRWYRRQREVEHGAASGLGSAQSLPRCASTIERQIDMPMPLGFVYTKDS